jgi:hypothetical protein
MTPPADAARPSPQPQQRVVVASNWRPREVNTLQGFFDAELPSGFTLRDLTLHEQFGSRWVGLPGKPQLASDGTVRRDPKSGKALYTTVVEIRDKAERERFQAAALAALDRLRAGGER